MNIFVFLILLKILLCPLNVFSNSSVVHHGTYKDWSVFSVSYEIGKVCYITSMPVSSLSFGKKTGQPYVMIAKFPDNKKFEFSVSTNKNVSSNMMLLAKVDKGPDVDLISNGDISRIDDPEMNNSIIYAMRKGLSLTVSNDRDRLSFSPEHYEKKMQKDRSLIVDRYSLMGMNEAYRFADALCNEK